MSREFVASRLDVMGFAEAAAALSGDESLQTFQRLRAEMAGVSSDSAVHWHAVGARGDGPVGSPVPWLRLTARACASLICQRCLDPVDIDLKVDRLFRFAADEATAAAEDEESEEDVLVTSREFDLLALVEDELLMEVPSVPRHEVCPRPVRLAIEDVDFETAEESRPNPFAVLGVLRTPKAD